MKSVLLHISFVLLVITAKCQQRVSFEPGKQPYLQVDSFATELNYLVLNPAKIKTVNVSKDSTLVGTYGQKARYGVVTIKTKPNTQLLRIGDILNKYNIAKTDRGLRICINKNLMKQPELLLVEASEIITVEITSDWHWINPADANSNEKFINIITSSSDTRL